MSDLISIAGKFAEDIKNSDIYQSYLLSQEKIRSNDRLNEQIANYKKLHLNYHLKKINSANPTFDEEKNISHIYWELMLNEDAKEYLDCEKRLVETLNMIYNIIGNACEIDLF